MLPARLLLALILGLGGVVLLRAGRFLLAIVLILLAVKLFADAFRARRLRGGPHPFTTEPEPVEEPEPEPAPLQPARGAMTRAEALEILGLAPGADAAAVKSAHRRLIARLHPDQGGTTYLAAQLNRARDMLEEDEN
jgi:hypothetical protein